MNAKEVFDKLVGIAHGYSWRLSSLLRSTQVNRGKPGELLDKLSPEEREELMNLTAKDIKDADRDTLLLMLGSYPENTTTVHSHSVKKDDE